MNFVITFDQKKMGIGSFGSRKSRVPKILGPYWTQSFLDPRSKDFGSEKIWVQEDFWSRQIFWLQRFLGQKKCKVNKIQKITWCPKYFGPTNL